MTRVTLHFREMLQDSQELGDDEHMVSRIYFSIVAGERAWSDLQAIVRQTVGASYATDPLEVELPTEYDGPIHHQRFRDCVEAAYRRAVSVSGPVRGNIRMHDNRFGIEHDCTFETEEA